MKNSKINKMTTIGILSALAIILALAFGIPIIPAAPFLKYDPKDVIIVIGAFIYGPHASIIMSSICAVLEVVFKGGNIIDMSMQLLNQIDIYMKNIETIYEGTSERCVELVSIENLDKMRNWKLGKE